MRSSACKLFRMDDRFELRRYQPVSGDAVKGDNRKKLLESDKNRQPKGCNHYGENTRSNLIS
jgi:hypothetical protein